MRHILDVSNIVYHGGNLVEHGFPCGGIKTVLGIINAKYKSDDIIICFDGGHTVKKELLPTYKAGRVPNFSIMAQLDLLREILIDCNIPFYYIEGEEADDIIYSYCKLLSDIGDTSETIILSDDKDLSCCVTNFISQQPVTPNGNLITVDSFSSQAIRGKTIPYNTVLLYKFFYGDSSDNYKGLKIEGMDFETLSTALTDCIQYLTEEGNIIPDMAMAYKSVISSVIASTYPNLSEYDWEKINRQLDIVVPREINILTGTQEDLILSLQTSKKYQAINSNTLVCTYDKVNHNKLKFYSTVFRASKVRTMFNWDSEECKNFQHILELKATELSQGVMAAEKYMSMPQEHPSTHIDNMELPD